MAINSEDHVVGPGVIGNEVKGADYASAPSVEVRNDGRGNSDCFRFGVGDGPRPPRSGCLKLLTTV